MPKKTKVKKPERGFATTSTIKKKDPEVETIADETPAIAGDSKGLEQSGPSSKQPENGHEKAIANGVAHSWEDSDERKAQDAEQALAEKVKSLSEKEYNKQIKILEYEKRMSSSYADFFWDDPTDVRDRIIKLALAESHVANLQQYNESEEKLLARIGALYLILQKLGFSATQIEECLTKVPSLELDSAVDWLYLRYSPSSSEIDSAAIGEVPAYGAGYWPDEQLAMPEKIDKKRITPKPATSPPQPAPPTNDSPVKMTAAADSSVEKSALLAYRNGDSDSEEETDSTSEPKNAKSGSQTVSSEDLDEMEDNPDAAYIATKMQITTLQRNLGIAGKGGKKGAKTKARPAAAPIKENKAELEQLQQLETLLKRIQQMYLFDQKRAEAAYAVERARVDKLELAERLAGKAKVRQQAEQPEPTDLPTEKHTPKIPDAIAETSADDSLLGGMLDEATEAEVESAEPERNFQGSIIVVRDMSLPKGFTGKTPRSLLEDTIRRLDKFGKGTYRVISRSRAIRAVVTIRWDSGKMQQFGMEDEACENQDQAFHYVSTLALFALAGDTSPQRLLPTKYRDLWDELAARSKDHEQQSYRQRLQVYKRLAIGRHASVPPAPSISPSIRPKAVDGEVAFLPDSPISARKQRESPEDLIREMQERQNSPSYVAMLPQRQSLPIAAYRDLIVSTIEENPVTVLCGETGCGKSTQTPTMILEHMLGQGRSPRIFCTEPRRISAISLAQRVSQELGDAQGALGTRSSYVGYNIRLEARVSAATRLTYATTGILLRMLEGDTELLDVTHIIIDEVHERSIDSDFLLIILRGLLRRRPDLRILLMSATVDADKIASYMGGCPVIQAPGRTFPVTPYFLEDAVEISQYRLDQDSDSPYVDRMQRKARFTASDEVADLEDAEGENVRSVYASGYSTQTVSTLQAMNESVINFDLLVQLLETICFSNQQLQAFSSAILVFLPSLDTIRRLVDLLESHPAFGSNDFRIFPLHSSISNEQQARVFEIPPHGVRKIVVSTNIAETGVTIPDVTAVVDSGRHKEMRFDEKRQISRLVECWIARSNAMQRRGRAGRVQEGICFHLFSKARMEASLAEHPIPEMLRLSLQDLALRIKILGFPGSIEDTLSQALDPPIAVNIQRAIASLIEVKALTTNEEITQLGKHLVKLPLDVHTAKLCLLSTIFGCLDAALTIAATLNSKSFFLSPFGREAEADTVKRSFKMADEHSDFLVIYRAYCLWRRSCEDGNYSTFTRKHFLSHTNLVQIEELKSQYVSNLIEAGFISSENGTARYPKCPRVRFAKLDPYLDRACKDSSILMAVIAASMHPKLVYKDVGAVWKTLSNNAPVAIHPSSTNFIHGRRPDLGSATFLTYFNIQQSKRLYIWENGAVSEKAVMLLCGDADVKHSANTLSIDRKIRRHVDRKSGLAIEILRKHFDDVLQARLDAPSSPLTAEQDAWFRLMEEALASGAAAEEKRLNSKIDKPSVSISVVRPTAM